jgi:hypothetical protein
VFYAYFYFATLIVLIILAELVPRLGRDWTLIGFASLAGLGVRILFFGFGEIPGSVKDFKPLWLRRDYSDAIWNLVLCVVYLGIGSLFSYGGIWCFRDVLIFTRISP